MKYAPTVKGVAPVHEGALSPTAQMLLRRLHQTIRQMTQDFQGRWHFNTCICRRDEAGE